MTVEQRLEEFRVLNGQSEVPDSVKNFLEIVRAYHSCGLSHNLLMILIEWEWDHQTKGKAYGLDYMNRQLKVMADEVEMLAKLLADNNIEIPADPV